MANVQVDTPIGYPRSSQTINDNVVRIGLSYLGWLTLFFVSGWLSRLLIPPVRNLKPKEQMFWQLAMVRGVCGGVTLWAAYIVFVDARIAKDYVMATTDESWTFVSLITGFFIFEELTLIYFDIRYRSFSKELHIHHFFGFNGFFLAAYYGRAHFYAAKAFILEGSTPFSCLCWCLLKLKLENTKAWKINQWVLINVFHLRSVLEFWWWYDIYQDWNNITENLAWPYTINMLMGLSMISFWLTPYWTYKKTKQFFFPVDWNDETKGKKVKKQDDEIDKTS